MPRSLRLGSHGETHMECKSRRCARFCSEQGLATGDPQDHVLCKPMLRVGWKLREMESESVKERRS